MRLGAPFPIGDKGWGSPRAPQSAPAQAPAPRGWQTGAILTLQGGFPSSVGRQSNATYQNTDSTCRADAVGVSPSVSNPTPKNWYNLAAFTNRSGFTTGVGPYRFGNSGRNNVVGPGITALDVSVAKQFRLTERARMDFRAEFFNLPNHPIQLWAR